MPPKRKTSATGAASRKKSKTDHNDVTANVSAAALPLDQWRVVMTGEFQDKTSLEIALKDKGVAITGSVSGKTTHLILGKSGTNEYGKPTGIGSKKHSQAKEKGLPIISEKQAYDLLQGKSTTADVASEAAAETAPLKKPAKSAKVMDKVLYVVTRLTNEGNPKVSLAKIKSTLSEEFEMDFGKAQTKNSLKKALDAAVNKDATLVKDGASYKLPNDGNEVDPAAVAQIANNYQEEADEADLTKLVPEQGRWRGLYVLSKKKSKSGRAKCGCCGALIPRGEVQVEASDDSLFKMLVFPGDSHEGVSRGYVECGYPGFEVVGRKKFFLHEGCWEDANDMYQTKFDLEWARLRPYVIQSFS